GLSKWLSKFYTEPYRRKVLTLVLLGIILHGSLIAIDQAFYHGLIGPDYERGSDLPIFRERAETILGGGLLYRDVHTETPPVVNYLMTIPVLFGGSLLAFQVFFSTCNILAALLILETFRKRNERCAGLAAILFLINPFTLYHSTFNPQDEPLIVLLFLLPLYLLLSDRFRSSALATGVGIWTKMWTLLLLPIYWKRSKDNRVMLTLIALIGVILLIIALPFLMLCPRDFSWFLRYYFLGVEGEGSGGVSLWHFLDQIGLKPPSVIMLGLVGTAVLGGYWYAHRKEWGPWKTITFVMVLFFLFYPKIHSGYYLIPLALMLPYIAQKIWLYPLTFAMFATVAVTFKFADGTVAPTGYLIAIPIALS
ncbi:unnamed protein product, partial [marine sediment metagenome]